MTIKFDTKPALIREGVEAILEHLASAGVLDLTNTDGPGLAPSEAGAASVADYVIAQIRPTLVEVILEHARLLAHDDASQIS